MTDTRLKNFQKSLRENQTVAELRLWHYLRNRRFAEFKFRRQCVLQGYIVDFVCLQKKLIVELDGSQHMAQEEYDNRRTKKLEQDGFQVLRFWDNDMLRDTKAVLDAIYNALIIR